MKIPEIVKQEAQKYGLCDVFYVGMLDGTQVFQESSTLGENGLPEPTGLPCCILLTDGKTELICGNKALELLSRFD